MHTISGFDVFFCSIIHYFDHIHRDSLFFNTLSGWICRQRSYSKSPISFGCVQPEPLLVILHQQAYAQREKTDQKNWKIIKSFRKLLFFEKSSNLYKPNTHIGAFPNLKSHSAVILARHKISPSLAACRIWAWIPVFLQLGHSLLAMKVTTKLANWRTQKAPIPYLHVVTRSDLLMNLQMLVKQAQRKKLVK